MDLLGSILSNMTKPPTLSDKEKDRRKKEAEALNKMEEKNRAAMQKFRRQIEDKVSEFAKNTDHCHKFAPMEKYEINIVHDVVEIAGLVAHTFEDPKERAPYLVIWKPEDPPTDDELECLKRNITQERWKEIQKEKEEQEVVSRKRKDNFVPKKDNMQSKYKHLIGKDAAVKTNETLKKSFGMVSVEAKKDYRTVEDIQAEIKAKKAKIDQPNE